MTADGGSRSPAASDSRPVLGSGVSEHQSRPATSFRRSARSPEGCYRVRYEKLQVSFSRSSGPGGQHVNKVSSRAEVRFHVQTADWLPTAVRREILSVVSENLSTKGSEVHASDVSCDHVIWGPRLQQILSFNVSRCQHRNLQECVRKISELIKEANQKLTDSINREKSENVEDEQKQFRLKRWNEQRLRQKKIASAIKKSRRMDYD
ncbi:hypothetical protein DNTS_020488 [Danionella cerebrum]|uniref:Large ribosomal subunit protein mL62 n=1 Tax=Danionella cerebrum TaxID=2873325 RepID=A0A553Q4K9_9TELE|nr:hypothetical protein DNTS_020488 [Danionella translucida]